MLAFGVTALKTRRFDTVMCRGCFFIRWKTWNLKMGLPPGQHIYEARGYLAALARNCTVGYIAEPSLDNYTRDGWRSTYSVVASLAGKYDVARKQMEALNWQPHAAWSPTIGNVI